MPRHLLSTRRAVDPDRRARYDRLWARVRSAAEAGDVHAWRFRAAERPEVFMEFIEGASAAALGAANLAAALRELDNEMGSGDTQHWEDAP